MDVSGAQAIQQSGDPKICKKFYSSIESASLEKGVAEECISVGALVGVEGQESNPAERIRLRNMR